MSEKILYNNEIQNGLDMHGITKIFVLPTKMHSPTSYPGFVLQEYQLLPAKEYYENMGIAIVGSSGRDNYLVTIPDGWEIKASYTRHKKTVYDEKGRERFEFYYNKGVYNHFLYTIALPRYRFVISPSLFSSNTAECNLILLDGGTESMVLNTVKVSSEIEHEKIRRKFSEEGKLYLKNNFPKWEDPLAYWDELKNK